MPGLAAGCPREERRQPQPRPGSSGVPAPLRPGWARILLPRSPRPQEKEQGLAAKLPRLHSQPASLASENSNQNKIIITTTQFFFPEAVPGREAPCRGATPGAGRAPPGLQTRTEPALIGTVPPSQRSRTGSRGGGGESGDEAAGSASHRPGFGAAQRCLLFQGTRAHFQPGRFPLIPRSLSTGSGTPAGIPSLLPRR